MNFLQMSFAGAILILVVAVVRAVAINRLPKKTFIILWGVVLFRLLIPYTMPSVFSVYTLIKSNTPVIENVDNGENEYTNISSKMTFPNNKITLYTQKNELPQAADNKTTHVSIASIVWFVGMMCCATFFIIGYLHWYFEFRTALLIQNDFVNQWRKKHSIKRSFSIRQSDKISSPLTYGIIKPVILMPKKTDWENTRQLEYVLLHEFMHISRYDSVPKLLSAIALCLHWFNPFVWVMYILLQRDIELACDESVVRRFGEASKTTYAHMLIDMEARKSGLMPLCNNFSKNAIEERIIAVMKIKKTSVIAILAAIVLVAGITTAFATTAAAKKTEYNNTDFSKEEMDKLLALRFDGYEDMSVSEFQEKAWKLTDTREYLDLLERFSQDTAFYEKKDSDELANFLFYTFDPLTGDKWQTREFGGYCEIENANASDSATLEYFITLDIKNADTLTVREYNNARIGIASDLHEWLQDKAVEMLQAEAVMQKMLHTEVEVLKTQWSSENLKVDIDYVYTPLSTFDMQNSGTVKNNIQNNSDSLNDTQYNNENNTQKEQEPREYPNGTEEDYRSLLALKTSDYQKMSVADFNMALLEWANENYERMERINIDTAYNDFAVNLTDDERSFVALSVWLSGMENGCYVRSSYTGKSEEDPVCAQQLPEKADVQNGQSAWCDLYYQFTWHITDKNVITVGERDHCVNSMITGVQEFWNHAKFDDLLNMSKEDITKTLNEIAATHSNDKITIAIAKDQTNLECIHLERMDERGLNTENEETGVIYSEAFQFQDSLPEGETYHIRRDVVALNVREDASENAAVVTLLPGGQKVIVMEEKDGFYHISIPSAESATNLEGWVKKEYVEVVSETAITHSNDKITNEIRNRKMQYEEIEELGMETEDWYKAGVINVDVLPYQEELSRYSNLNIMMNVDIQTLEEAAPDYSEGIPYFSERPKVIIIEEKKDFYHILGIENNFDGWVKKEYVDIEGYIRKEDVNMN